jgi:acyl dehydratase
MKIKNFEEIPVGVQIVNHKPKKIWYLWTFIFGLLTGDLNPAHINIFTFKKNKSKFKGLVAHGISTVAKGEGFILKIFHFEKVTETIAKGYRDIRYLRPVFMGDLIEYRYTILEKNIKKESCCECLWLVEGYNQDKKQVFSAKWEIVYFLI